MIKMINILLLISLLSFNFRCHNNNPDGFDLTRKNFMIQVRDGTRLDCTSFAPTSDKPELGFPCIVYCHGYGQSKDNNLANAIMFAKLGFSTYAYSMRGQGYSEGESNLISIIEADDLIDVINYVKKDPLVDKDRIAVIGSSQGGIIPMMASCSGLEVKCLISDLISPDFASNWISNGCIKMSLLWSLSYTSDIIRYNNEVSNYRNWILSKERDKWDSLSTLMPAFRDFSTKLKNISVPSYISNSFEDKYFSANTIIENISNFPPTSKFYFGAIEGHGSITTDDETAYHDKTMKEWLNYYLKDKVSEDSSIYTASLSSFPLVNNIWSFQRISSNTSFFENPLLLQLYFHPMNIISEIPNYGDTTSFIFSNKIPDESFTMTEAVNFEFKGDYFNRKFIKENLIFETEPIEWNYNFLGIPKIHLVYKSDSPVCQFNFQIYEVFEDGTSKFVSSINYTDRNFNSKKPKTVDIKGDAAGHIFTSHSKIRVILTNIDSRENDNFLRTNPYVLPVLEPATNTIYIGGRDGSYIELPIKE